MAQNQVGNALVYHEKQDAGLCAVHALNSLLQGPYYTEVDLATIALEFDRREKAVMSEMGTETNEFLRYMAEDSGNVADDGNYSVQVIQTALDVWNLKLITIESPDAKASKANPLGEQAFVCNLSSHWLTIRLIDGDWFNFNSLLDKPQFLSPFYLSAFLDTLISQGYSIFVVKGSLPIQKSNSELSSKNWISVPRKPVPLEELKKKKTGPKTQMERELEQAIQQSLKMATPGEVQGVNADKGDKALQAAMEASMADYWPESPVSGRGGGGNEEDEELQRALMMSMEMDEVKQK
eukprot:TRINITY_DN5367_c0_g1_i1.p1 TRINITY_DN5367_c0_g1~~TRINITY_DN5367_c0_g1_i1.p1  ORF type:complete len:294 (+),score=86.14 TRINITY_DN5367_c0_g1_i1:61-942(+)